MQIEERTKIFQEDKEKSIKERSKPSLIFFENNDLLSDV